MTRRRQWRGGKGFTALYDKLREEIGCPTRTLFTMACDPEVEPQHRITAAKSLLRHRYPTHVVLKEMDAEDEVDELTALLRSMGQERRDLQHQPANRLELDEAIDADYEEVLDDDPLLR